MAIDRSFVYTALRGVLLLALLSACGQSTGCSGCDGEDNYVFPPKNRIYNAAQLRVTRSGLAFLEENLEPLLAAALPEDGLNICLPGESGNVIGIDYGYCHREVCPDGQLGCQLNIGIGEIDLTAEAPSLVRARLEFEALSAQIPIEANPIAECAIEIDGEGFDVEFTLDLQTPDPEKFLGFELAGAPTYQLSDLDVQLRGRGGALGWVCDGVSVVVNLPFIRDLIFDGIQTFIDVLVADQIDSLVGGFTCVTCEMNEDCAIGSTCESGQCRYADGQCVQAKIGVEGRLDLGELLATTTPGLTAALEYLASPGGYVDVENGGISLGVVAGAISQRNRCVPLVSQPPIVAPERSELLRGNMDLQERDYELGIGITREIIEHFSWALFNAGTLCLEVSNNTVDQLNAGILSIVLPNLSTLAGNPEAPIAISLAPQRPPEIEFGTNQFDLDEEGNRVLVDPALRIRIPELWLDWHVFMDDRWVRIFSLYADVDLPLGLDFTPDNEVIPIIGDLSMGLTNLRTANNRIMQDDPTLLATLLPAILNVFVGDLVGGLINPIALPDVLGFRLNLQNGAILSIEEGGMLAIFAGLDAVELDEQQPGQEEGENEGALTAEVETRIVDVVLDLPDSSGFIAAGPDTWRAITAFVEVEAGDGRLRETEFEYSWRLGGTTWSPFQTGDILVVRHPLMHLQGKHTLEVRARRVGDYRSLDSTPAVQSLLVDTMAPSLSLSEENEMVTVSARDLVSRTQDLVLEYRHDGASWSISEGPNIEWDSRENLTVRVTDEMGHSAEMSLAAKQSSLIGRPPPGSRGGAGCDCDIASESSSPSGTFWLTVLLLIGWRRRRGLCVLSMAAICLLVACDDNASANLDGDRDQGMSTECDDASDCDSQGQICVEGRCEAVDCREDSSACLEVFCEEGVAQCTDSGRCICGPPCGGACGDSAYCCEAENECIPLPDECRADACPEGVDLDVSQNDTGDPSVCGDETFQCECQEEPSIDLGPIGRYSDLAIIDGVAWVSAYSDTYGDLVVGRYERANGFVWYWVDGVPENAEVVANPNGARGGVVEGGPDVGQYTALGAGPDGTLHVAYYDVDAQSLKYAAGRIEEGEPRWQIMELDDGGDAGRWSSISLDPEGRPGIAYRVANVDGVSQVRYLQARTSAPESRDDWGEPLILQEEPVDPETLDTGTYPEGTGLFTSQDREPGGSAVVAWYNRSQGSLWMTRMNDAGFDEPEMLAGWGHPVPDRDGDMGANVDLTVDVNGEIHLCYQDGLTDSLRYLSPQLGIDEWVDDGVWLDVNDRGHSVHVVGDDCSISLDRDGRPVVVYQDATMQALLLRRRNQDNMVNGLGWSRRDALRGDGAPDAGAFGFFTQSRRHENQLWIIHFIYRNLQPEREHGIELLRVDL